MAISIGVITPIAGQEQNYMGVNGIFNSGKTGIRALLVAAVLTCGAAEVRAQGKISSDINDYICSKLDDFSGVMKVVSHDDEAGGKINKDFPMIYQLKGDVKVQYKEENHLRLDARLKTANVIFIINGTKQTVIAKTIGLHTVNDLGPNPGKRKTLLDVGMVSRAYLSYSNAEFKGAVNYKGVMCAKFKLWYKDKSDTSFRLVWIDPKTKVTLKREDYSQLGKLNATYTYMDPKEVVPGIWFPTHVAAANNEGQKAGELSYNEVKVNQGIEDDVFTPR
jgi:outer membrane lipoprotein-sorting protein